MLFRSVCGAKTEVMSNFCASWRIPTLVLIAADVIENFTLALGQDGG
jgi:hypothetical protein